MNLIRCHILGFGKLAGPPLSFAEGLNVVYAANEGGKSTLQRVLTALLYGQLRPDVKAQRRLDPWVEQYKPWRGTEYGATLWCRLTNGRELEIHRRFGRDESRLEIRTSGGEEISREYETLRNGDVLFAATHLGLAKELFESIAVIRESETTEIKYRETLRDRIANLAQSGDEKLSVRLSLVKLEEALESIGSERAPTKPYKQALDRFQELREEWEELETLRRQCQAWIEERVRLGAEIGRLEQDLAAAGRGIVEARWREARLQVQTLEEIDAELRELRGDIESLGANPEFPVHRLDELNRLVADGDNMMQRLEELHGRTRDSLSRHEQFALELQKLAAYARLQATVETEKITEWFVSFLGLTRQKDDLQRTAGRLLDEAAVLMRRMDGLSPALQDDKTDWERKARQAAEEERSASDQHAALAGKVAQCRSEHARISSNARRQTLLAVLAIVCALALGAGGPAGGIVPTALWLVPAGVLGVAGAILMMAASRSRVAAQQAKQSYDVMDAGLKRMRDQALEIQSELREAVSSSGFTTVEEFLAAARQTALDRQRLADLAPRIREAEQHRDRIQGEADAVYAHLRECLSIAGLGCAPGNLKAPVDALRANLKRHAELQAGQRRVDQEMAALKTDEESLGIQAAAIAARIQAILGEAEVESPEAFRQGYENCRRLADLRAREASRGREFDRLRGNLALEQWKERLEELQKLRGESGEAGRLQGVTPGQAPSLPYLPTVDEAEQEERRLADLLSGRREEHARLVERVRQAFHNYRAPAEIEEDLVAAERAIQEFGVNRKALNIALDSIRTLARLQQEVCAPQLNRAVEERFLQLCPEGYEEVKIDPDFRIQVREKGAVELRPVESLSRGTQDQVYFAVRFGVLELLASSQESCPCLLDEPFVAYDQDRMGAAFRILEAEADRRQLILFTCRVDVRTFALQHGAHLVTL